MADKSKTIIVRKVKKGHAASHGGSWKVAYADFVTAMMAFFLLLWLISMVTPDKRAAVADYFRNFNIFTQGGKSFMDKSSSIQTEVKTSTQELVTGEVTAETVQQKLKLSIDEKLSGMKEQVLIDIVDGGIRIQLIDSEGNPLFPSGSADPNSVGKQIIRVVAENLKDMQNRLAVEGHTDAAPYRKGNATNWELSAQRAAAARRELEADGIDPKRFARVVGHADQEPLFRDKPNDPRNRRISIIMLASEKKTFSLEKGTETQPPGTQPLPVLPQSATTEPEPRPQVKPVPQPSPVKPGKKEGDKIFDTGIKEKPIEIIPGIGR
jgi:chemotaxis protein MotB